MVKSFFFPFKEEWNIAVADMQKHVANIVSSSKGQ